MTSSIINDLTINDFSIGQVFSFQKKIDENDLNRFAELSGDSNPLHMNDEFAKERGLQGCVAHGLLLSSFFSKMVGMHCPGKNALLHSANLKFLLPAYVNDIIVVQAVVGHISLSTNILLLDGTITNETTNKLLVKGKIQVGFTKNLHGNG